MSERVDVQQLRDRFIEKAHYGNGTGCRCCHLVDDGILTALLARLEALEALVTEAYDEWGDEGHPTNAWRIKAERLGAWPSPREQTDE